MLFLHGGTIRIYQPSSKPLNKNNPLIEIAPGKSYYENLKYFDMKDRDPKLKPISPSNPFHIFRKKRKR